MGGGKEVDVMLEWTTGEETRVGGGVKRREKMKNREAKLRL